ncbi:MAG: hypothetical protein QG626_652 [Patescibacteria group bacterium]|jgi:hypothetical protein|nr:hypothetical protein [Patescibacteria group bacterium]
MPFGEMGRRFEKAVKGAMLGAALSGSGEARAEVPQVETHPTEQSAFVPEVIQAEWRKLKVISVQDVVPNPPPGYEPQEIPGNKYQYIEITPVGWHKQRTPEGSIFVKDCPVGFHEVHGPEGTTYVENNPDGSDEPQTVADASPSSKSKTKNRKSGD